MRVGFAPTYGKRYSGRGSGTCTPASLPVNGIQPLSWSISSCRTDPAWRLSRQPIVTEYSMSATFSFEVSHLPEVRTISVVPACKTAKTGAVIHCDLAH